MSSRIAIDRLTKRFPAIGAVGGAGTTTAVDAVSLVIEPGELFFLLGPSGCGKTTLLRMIAGFIDPTEGRITFQVDDQPPRDVTHLPPNHRNTGMVFQSYALWPHMTVAKNVAFGLDVRKVPPADKDRRVREALDVVRMGQYAERKPNQLSGGQQQRVALARALVIRPDVLLLDEPLSNLDAKLRHELRSEIRRICKEAGTTSVYVTHDQKEALSMADRVAIVNQGRIEQLGPPGEIYRRPRSRFVADFLGETNFLPCTVLGPATSPGSVRVRTPAGDLEADTPAASTPAAPASALCMVRPESWRLSAAGAPSPASNGHGLEGRVVEFTYLGELAQLAIELKPAPAAASAQPITVRAATLNPGAATRVGETVRLDVAPTDVVLLPA